MMGRGRRVLLAKQSTAPPYPHLTHYNSYQARYLSWARQLRGVVAAFVLVVDTTTRGSADHVRRGLEGTGLEDFVTIAEYNEADLLRRYPAIQVSDSTLIGVARHRLLTTGYRRRLGSHHRPPTNPHSATNLKDDPSANDLPQHPSTHTHTQNTWPIL